jgi:peptide-methionine (S)-S-oxide reductase
MLRPISHLLVAAGVALGGIAMFTARGGAGAAAVAIPAPEAGVRASTPPGQEVAIFSGGCFWGVQAVFQHTKGVISAVSGYTGGAIKSPGYEVVSTGITGHAESVQVTFDPSQVSYADLLHVFFSVVHDPTTLNYQGPDHGTQYRSAIWYTSDAQKAAATAYIAQLGKANSFRRPIVTQVAPAQPFYPAEGYHQDYVTVHPTDRYVAINDAPKVVQLKAMFPALYREHPVLVSSTQQ